MKEITVEEVFYDGCKYQLDKPLILNIKEVNEIKENTVPDNNYTFTTGYYNGVPYQYCQADYNYSDQFKYCQHGCDNYYDNYYYDYYNQKEK